MIKFLINAALVIFLVFVLVMCLTAMVWAVKKVWLLLFASRSSVGGKHD